MKVTEQEIDAAISAYNGNVVREVGRKQINAMRAALEAAHRVRKQRKKEKRMLKEGQSAINEMREVIVKPAPKPSTGQFEAGKSYRTRDGRKVYLTKVDDRGPQSIRGAVPYHNFLQKWYANGRFRKGCETDLDLIALWTDQ